MAEKTDDEILREMEAEEAAKSAVQSAPAAPEAKKGKRGQAINLPVTLDIAANGVFRALEGPLDAYNALVDALVECERELKQSKTTFNKAVNNEISGANIKDAPLIINTKALNVDDAIQLVAGMRAKLAEAGLSAQAKALKGKKTSLEKGVKAIEKALRMMKTAA